MNQLDETDGLVVDGTRHNVVNNQVCLVTYKESNTEVTSLEDLNKSQQYRTGRWFGAGWKIHPSGTGKCRNSGKS